MSDTAGSVTDIDIEIDRDVGVVARRAGHTLLHLRAVPEQRSTSSLPASAAMLAALGAMAAGSPATTAALREAVRSGSALQVTFPNEVLVGLRTGTLGLMETSAGQMATAVDGTGRIVANGRVVAGTGAGLATGAGAGLTMGAAALFLPLAIAGAAAYAQQRRIERALGSIQAVVERIETRLIDAEDGVNDAAEQFLDLASGAIDEGGLTGYLRHELAAHRQAVESLYAAHRRRIRRLKATIEQQQADLERKSGTRQPWVDAVVDAVKEDRFDDEVIRYLRALVARTKLNALTAMCLVEDGRPRSALELIATTERELRAEFYDLHNRLSPLARIEPDVGLIKRLPGLRSGLVRAQQTVKALVEHIDQHVLPIIPDPDNDAELVALISSADARRIFEQTECFD